MATVKKSDYTVTLDSKEWLALRAAIIRLENIELDDETTEEYDIWDRADDVIIDVAQRLRDVGVDYE